MQARSFYMPGIKGMVGHLIGDGIRGPAKLADLEKVCKDPAAKELLWSASEKACGPFFA